MKNNVKVILFLSTAYLFCSNGGTSILAMQTTPPQPNIPLAPNQIQDPNQPMQRGGPNQPMQRGGPNQPMQRGGPNQPMQRGGPNQPMIARGGALTQKQGPSSITEACNKCARELEEEFKKITIEQTMKLKIATVIGSEEDQIKRFQENFLKSAKASLLDIIVLSLEKEFEYLDQPVPNEQKVQEIVTQACNTIKNKLETMIEEEINTLNKPTKKSTQKQLPRNLNDVPQEELFSNLKLKKTTKQKQEEILTKVEKAEVDIAKIQPDDNNAKAKMEADQRRLAEIKAYIKKEKGEEFLKNFTDAELLAFPLAVIVNLGPNDLEDKSNQGFNGRKYSDQSLEAIKYIRFNPNPVTHTPARMLTAENVKQETPLNLMRHNLSITDVTISKLKNEGHLH